MARRGWRESITISPKLTGYPGAISSTGGAIRRPRLDTRVSFSRIRSRHQNCLFSDSYTFGPSYTNEFRFSYARPRIDFSVSSPDSVALARTLPQIRFSTLPPGTKRSKRPVL